MWQPSDKITRRAVVAVVLMLMVVLSGLIVVWAVPSVSVFDATEYDPVEKKYRIGTERISVQYGSEDILDYNGLLRNFSMGLWPYRFVTVDDPVIVKTYDALEPYLEGRDDYGRADLLRMFVQDNVVYKEDIDLFGTSEYIQYPSETLINGRGDCEDTSILLYTLYSMAGLDAVFVKDPGHWYVGVAVDGDGEYLLDLFGKRYYTVETTNWEGIGQKDHDGPSLIVFGDRTVLMEAMLAFTLLLILMDDAYLSCLKRSEAAK